MKLQAVFPFLHRMSMASLICLLLAAPATAAIAGDCDGTVGIDDITCSTDLTAPDPFAELGLGNDTFEQDAGTSVAGVNGDGTPINTLGEGNGGNDTITINGTVTGVVIGDYVNYANGYDGGDDTIIINGTADGIQGDHARNGGDDTIIINGTVSYIYADNIVIEGGSDDIQINGTVTGFIEADDDGRPGGDDTVTLGTNAEVVGTIDGGDGTDTLRFRALRQSELSGYSAAGGTLTVNGHAYTWVNFESLIGLLQDLVENGARVLFSNGSLVAVEDDGGIKVLGENGRIANVPLGSLAALAVGESASFSSPNSNGWSVTVTSLGSNPNNPVHTLYRFDIYYGSSLQASFTFSN
ncbi:MAG: hypothetical protein WD751_04495 [Anaerolineales bacterium]